MQKSVLLFLSSFLLLPSCSTPPDVLGCTGYLAADWPELRETFFKLCSDDPACAVRLPRWREVVSSWAAPTDSGTCVTWVSGRTYEVNPEHPAPIKNSDGPNKGKLQTWPELAETGVLLPAKASYAPLKTYVQSECHNSKKCGSIGNWEGTFKEIDSTLSVQEKKLKSAR